MAQKPDFMKAVKAVGQQMDATASQPRVWPMVEPQLPPASLQGFEEEDGISRLAQARATAQGKTKSIAKVERSASRTSATIYMDQDLYRRFKVLAAVEGRRLNDYFLEAVEDYVGRIGDRLPKL